MFLGRYSGSFFVGVAIVAGEVYGLSGSIHNLQGQDVALQAIGPIPAGATLLAVNVASASASATANYDVYLALSLSPVASVEAFRAASNLVAVATANPFTDLLGLRFLSGLGGRGGMRFVVGRRSVGGPRWVLFGCQSGVIAMRIVVIVNLEILPDSVGERASAGGGTVLDTLRASAADSL